MSILRHAETAEKIIAVLKGEGHVIPGDGEELMLFLATMAIEQPSPAVTTIVDRFNAENARTARLATEINRQKWQRDTTNHSDKN